MTLTAQNSNVAGSSKGEGEVLIEHYQTLGAATTNKTFDTEFEKETNAWAEAPVAASRRSIVTQKNCGQSSRRGSEEVCS